MLYNVIYKIFRSFNEDTNCGLYKLALLCKVAFFSYNDVGKYMPINAHPKVYPVYAENLYIRRIFML